MKKKIVDGNHYNLVGGELKESKNDLEILKEFIKRGEYKIKGIKKTFR